MADVPFPLITEDPESFKSQIWELFRQIYEEKIGGADLGDVFGITNDVLSLELASSSGLTKAGNLLAVSPTSTGGIQVTADGLLLKLVATGGLSASASGLTITVVATGGLEIGASGIGITLDGTTLTLSASGIKVSVVSTGWEITNKTEDRTLDCDGGDIAVVSDVLGTLIDDLKTKGILSA